MSIEKEISRSTIEIFTTMVMMEVDPVAGFIKDDGPLIDSITGLIGFAGTHKGALAIHLPNQVALDITSNFLGMDVEGINEDVEDAVGEIANMIGGDIKSYLSETGRDINLSLPSTISGAEYDFQPNKNAEVFMVAFNTTNGQFMVELQLEK